MKSKNSYHRVLDGVGDAVRKRVEHSAHVVIIEYKKVATLVDHPRQSDFGKRSMTAHIGVYTRQPYLTQGRGPNLLSSNWLSRVTDLDFWYSFSIPLLGDVPKCRCE